MFVKCFHLSSLTSVPPLAVWFSFFGDFSIKLPGNADWSLFVGDHSLLLECVQKKGADRMPDLMFGDQVHRLQIWVILLFGSSLPAFMAQKIGNSYLKYPFNLS